MKFRNMFVILEREYMQRVKKRSFLLSTILIPLIFLATAAMPMIISSFTKNESKELYNIAVIDNSNLIVDKLEGSNNITFESSSLDIDSILLPNSNFSAVMVIGADVINNPSNITIKMKKELNMKQENSITRKIEDIISKEREKKYAVENLDAIISDLKVKVTINTSVIDKDGEEKASSSKANFALGFLGGFAIYMFIFLYGGMILNSVIDEKSSKVVEVMVSTTSPFQMMMGKIMGIGLVAITQFVIWGIMLLIAGLFAMSMISTDDMMQAGQVSNNISSSGGFSSMVQSVADVSSIIKAFSIFIIFFIGGFLFYASFYAAIGSAVDNIQDVQQFQAPIIIPLIAAITLLPSIMENPNGVIAFWMSIIPMTSPIVMLARIPSGVPVWEIILSISVLAISFIAMIWAAGRIYRIGIFMHGKKPSFTELYKWIKYK